MAEGFGSYHVPQQSRREKLRVFDHNGQNLRDLVHGVYDSSNLIKGEAINLMGFDQNLVGSGSIQEMDPFLCDSRGFEQPNFDAHQVFVFMPEPLSLSLSSHGGGGGGYVGPGIVGGGDGCRSSVPLGPFTGYASILKGSRFLKPAQLLLEEFCDVGRVICAEGFAAEPSLMEQNPPVSGGGGGGDGGESQRRKSTLVSMLDEVYRRYKQYYQQMQEVAASFECVPGLGNAAPYANLALKTMSKHFKCLKDAISDQLQLTGKGHGKVEAVRSGNPDRGFYSQRGVSINNSGHFDNQPVWRPQRGLPERAVAVLRAWLFEHFLHPYPTDTDKVMLAKQTGLSRCQVSNWFINARVRLWKPMVEEIHMLETRQAHKDSPRDNPKCVGTVTPENPSSSQRMQESGGIVTRGGGTVSLTLGLHQNNCAGMPEPFPMNAPQRFGLGGEGNGDGFVMAGFESHFGREGAGGQLMHDFVG